MNWTKDDNKTDSSQATIESEYPSKNDSEQLDAHLAVTIPKEEVENWIISKIDMENVTSSSYAELLLSQGY